MTTKKQNNNNKIKAFRLSIEDFELLNKQINDYQLTDKEFFHKIIHNQLQYIPPPKEDMQLKQMQELTNAFKAVANNSSRALIELTDKHHSRIEALTREIGKLESIIEDKDKKIQEVLKEANNRIYILNELYEEKENDAKQLLELFSPNKKQAEIAATWLEFQIKLQKQQSYIEDLEMLNGQLKHQIATDLINKHN